LIHCFEETRMSDAVLNRTSAFVAAAVAAFTFAAQVPAAAQQSTPGMSRAERPPSDSLKASSGGMTQSAPAAQQTPRSVSGSGTVGAGPAAASPPAGLKASENK
jgi:hypothetical protein